MMREAVVLLRVKSKCIKTRREEAVPGWQSGNALDTL